MRKPSSGLFLAAALSVALAGCAGSREAREEQQFVEQPVEQIYNQATRALDRRLYVEAIAGFEEVQRQHPFSAWARRSMLMNAYANYSMNRYDKAIESARQFISLHPGNESAPYAYYIVALCYFEQIMDVGRDQKTTEEALQALQDVANRFPTSAYASDARLKIDMTYDQLAGKEMAIGRFYLRRDLHLAAINRFRTVVDNPNFQRTSHTPEALHRLVETYLAVGMTEEAQRAAATLGANFPGNPWYQRTYTLMTGRGIGVPDEQEARRRGWLSRLFADPT
jgi:outer membrane protein assembly factor BamD